METSLAKKSKRTRKGKGKGPRFERELSRDLSLWISDGKRDDIIWRTAGSGARATIRRKTGRTTANSCGDLKAEHSMALPLFEYCTIEAKNGYKDYSIQDLLDKPCTKKLRTVEEFYKQAVTDSCSAGVPFALLIMKKDRRLPIIAIPTEIYDQFEYDLECAYAHFSGNKNIAPLTFMALEDFFKEITFKQFINYCKKAVSVRKK